MGVEAMEGSHIQEPKWRVRLFICCVMLVLALIAAVLMDLHSRGYWFYSQAICITYAVLSIGLSLWTKKHLQIKARFALWRQVLHWVGLVFVVYIIDLFVQSGLMTNDGAGVVIMTCLALTVYAVGLYNDIALVFVGIALAIFSVLLSFFQQHLVLFMTPVLLVVAGIIFFIVYRSKD
jgi:hypothetical protein